MTSERAVEAGEAEGRLNVNRLAKAAQDHETSGIHGPLHCSLACGASLAVEYERLGPGGYLLQGDGIDPGVSTTLPPRLDTARFALGRLRIAVMRAFEQDGRIDADYRLTADRIAAEYGALAATSAPREDGWDELRREIEALHDDPIRFGSAKDASQNTARAVLAIVDLLAAARGEPPATPTEEYRQGFEDARAQFMGAARGEPPEPGLTQANWREAMAEAVATAKTAEAQRDQAWRNLDTAHEDIAAMLRASGLGDYARPISTHDVIQQELLPWIESRAARGEPGPVDVERLAAALHSAGIGCEREGRTSNRTGEVSWTVHHDDARALVTALRGQP